MKWKPVKLDTLFKIKHGFAFKSEFFAESGKYVLMTPGHFHEQGGFRKREGKEKFYSGLFNSDYLLKKGDLVIAMTEQGEGLLGSTAKVPESDRFLHNQRLGLVHSFDKTIIEKDFLYYLLNRSNVRAIISSTASGTKVRHTSPGRILAIEVLIPKIETQRRIASILTAYDDLIENNLRRIRLLEEVAQRTFEEWFVRFRVGGLPLEIDEGTGLPRGWKKINLGSMIGFEIGGGWGEDTKSKEFSVPAFVIRGTDIDELPRGKIQSVPFRFHKMSNLASRKLQKGDIVFEVSGGSHTEGTAKSLLITEGLLAQFNGDVMCASFCKLARPTSRLFSNFLYLFFRFLRKSKGTEIYDLRSASNIVNYNWSAFLKFQQVSKPDNQILEDFNEIIDPVFQQINNLGRQVNLLKTARDLLLPRLMSGEIEVGEEASEK